MKFEELPEFAKEQACETLKQLLIAYPHREGEPDEKLAQVVRDSFILLFDK